MKKLIEFFARQGLFSELITILTLGIGVFCLTQINRETFPNVQYDIITVYTFYPGASPGEVEKLITNPLEQDFKEIEGIKKMFSVSTEGRSGIIVQLDPDQTTQEEAKTDIQEVVDRFRDIPKEAEDPEVNALESKIFPVVEVGLGGGNDPFDLKEKARWLEEEIEKLPEVARVDLQGEREYEVRVEISAKKLRRYQLSFTEVENALKERNVSVPGGDYIQLKNRVEHDVIVRTDGQFENMEDIGETVVRSNDLGKPILLKDIATIRMDLKEAASEYNINGKPAIRLVVMKKEKADAIRLIDKLKVLMGEVDPKRLENVEYEYVNDMSVLIRNRLGVLSNNLMVGLFLVLIVLTFFLPFRVSMVTALGIPFAFLGTMAYFYLSGVSLNLITMMGLIIVIGMLVDDAVVITENAVRRMENGEDPMDAAVRGTQQIWLAVFASVMTTVLAFAPMTVMTGIFGKFVSFIPIGVICALLISLVECYFVLPYHVGRWVSLDSVKKPEKGLKARFEKVWSRYVDFYAGIIYKVTGALRYGVAVGFIFLLVGTGILFMSPTLMPKVLFPPKGVEQFLIKIKAPVGTSLEQTRKFVKPYEELVNTLPNTELKNSVTSLGELQARPDDPAGERGSHYAQIMVFLTPELTRNRMADEIIKDLKARAEYPDYLEVIFERINPGPPVGKAINIGVRGESYDEIMKLVNEIMEELRGIDGVQDITNNYSSGKDELIVKVNPTEARSVGLSTAAIGFQIRSAFEGNIATTLKSLDDEIDVRVSLPKEEKVGDGLGDLKILNPQGRLVTLGQVADFEWEKGIEAFYHLDNKRQVTIDGDVDTDVITADVVTKIFTDKVDEYKKRYPSLTLTFGGESEDTAESMESLVQAFLFALVFIYFLLILTFQSFIWPMIIILAIPIGVISVIWALFLHGQPVSFMGMLGIVALAGVIVNNAIVFVDFVKRERADGASKRESIVLAGRQRIRPIFLTTLTTVCGILPTAYGIGGLDQFIVPIAISLGWGMFIGSILSSFLLPTFIAIFDDVEWVLHRIRRFIYEIWISLFRKA